MGLDAFPNTGKKALNGIISGKKPE